jgi:hypothetical protein
VDAAASLAFHPGNNPVQNKSGDMPGDIVAAAASGQQVISRLHGGHGKPPLLGLGRRPKSFRKSPPGAYLQKQALQNPKGFAPPKTA